MLLHFELKNPILLDNTKTKKTNFVQFFVEVRTGVGVGAGGSMEQAAWWVQILSV